MVTAFRSLGSVVGTIVAIADMDLGALAGITVDITVDITAVITAVITSSRCR